MYSKGYLLIVLLMFWWLYFTKILKANGNDADDSNGNINKCTVEWEQTANAINKWNKIINCVTNDLEALKEELENINNKLPVNRKHFRSFTLNSTDNTGAAQLPQLFFANINLTFDAISLLNLASIHRNSFANSSTATETKHIEFNGLKTKLRNNAPDFDLYSAISSLESIYSVVITLEERTSHEIPENAFESIAESNKLTTLTFNGLFDISVIEDNAFATLSSLQYLKANVSSVQFINAHAFDFEQSSNDLLVIVLSDVSLNESSFEPGIFCGTKRPVRLILSNNNIRYIREETFTYFFKNHKLNQINIANNPIDCENVDEFEWLFNPETCFIKRIANANCKHKKCLELFDYYNIDKEVPVCGSPNSFRFISVSIIQFLVTIFVFNWIVS